MIRDRLHDLTLAQLIDYNLMEDDLSLSNELYNRMLGEAVDHSGEEGFKAETYFLHHEDFNISRVAAELVSDRYQISRHAGRRMSLSMRRLHNNVRPTRPTHCATRPCTCYSTTGWTS